MGAGNVAPAPLIWIALAASVAPASATIPNAPYTSFFMSVVSLEIHERMHRDPALRRLRRGEVVELRVIHVEKQRRRNGALVREPVRHPCDGSHARLIGQVLVRFEMVDPQQPFPALRRPGCDPRGPPASLE